MIENTVFERRGLWFEEFHVGLRIETPARTITEADVVNFAGLSGDFVSLHTEEVFAKRTPFRGRIAQGMLVQSVATGLGMRSGVFEGTIGALAGRVTFAAQGLNQKDKVVIESDWEALMLREGPARARAAREKAAGKTAGSGDKT